MTKRYDQLVGLILERSPRTIVEVGVHGALRAQMMCEAARRKVPKVKYLGYDVFETETYGFHTRALNGKGIPSQRVAERRMMDVARRVGGVHWGFTVGDTANTLHGRQVACDFAFVDGDHRVEMIRGDALALDCPCIVFDDYYTPGPEGVVTDTQLYGANAVVEELAAAGRTLTLLPKRDLTKEGCYAQLAMVTR